MFKQTSSKQSLIEVHGKLIKEALMVLIMEFRQLETNKQTKKYIYLFKYLNGFFVSYW
jgi:hypothetical protein